MSRPDVLLSLDGVGKTFSSPRGHVEVLKDLSLDVMAGESIAVIGANGVGKSTLLALVAGTLSPTVGAIRRTERCAALLELGVGMEPELTGRENLDFHLAVLGLSRAARAAVTDDVIDFADLGASIDLPLKTYSDGMSAKLAVAAVLHSSAELLLIDEALSVGDHRFQRAAIEKCSALVAEGAALLFVTHDPVVGIMACNQAIWLDGGTVALRGPAEEVTAAYITQFNRHRGLAIDPDVTIDDVVVSPAEITFDTEVRVTVTVDVKGTTRPSSVCIELLPCIGTDFWWARNPRTIIEYRSIEVIGTSTDMDLQDLGAGRSILDISFETFPVTPPNAELAIMLLDASGDIMAEATVHAAVAEAPLDTPVLVKGTVLNRKFTPFSAAPRYVGDS